MFDWIKDYFDKRRLSKELREKEWHVMRMGDRAYFLAIPRRYDRDESFDTWINMETEIYSRIQRHWPDSHTYIRLLTYHVPYRIITGLADRIPTADEREYLYIIPDCQDKTVWTSFFSTSAFDTGRMIFTVDTQPLVYGDVVQRMVGVVQNSYHGKSIVEFTNELSSCRCLAYSIDSDLVLAKVDLADNDIVSVLCSLAEEYNLELVWDIDEIKH